MSEVLRKSLASVTAVAALGSLAACGADKGFEIKHRGGVEYVELKDGAKLRTEPWVPGEDDPAKDTLLVQLNIDKIDPEMFKYDGNRVIVTTPKGVDMTADNNGKWIGIPVEDIKVNVYEDSVQDAIANDEDGVVWVSMQRADILRRNIPERIG